MAGKSDSRVPGAGVVHQTPPMGISDWNLLHAGGLGHWTSSTGGLAGKLFDFLGVLAIIYFGLLSTFFHSDSHLLAIGVFYMLMTAFAVRERTLNDISPGAAGASIDFGPLGRWPIAVVAGLGIGVAFVVLFRLVSPAQALPFESAFQVGHTLVYPNLTVPFTDIPLSALLLYTGTTVWIPIAEEYLYDGFAAPSTAELMPLAASIPFVAVVWSLWHLGAYHTSPHILIVLFAFRIIAELLTFYTKSVLGGLVAHIIVNTAAILFPVA